MSIKNKSHTLWTIWVLGLMIYQGTQASPDKDSMSPSISVPLSLASQPELIFFTPPKRGAPITRIGGGTRGDNHRLILNVLAPEQTSWTSKTQPVLYWSISAPTTIEHELILNDDHSVKPLLAIHSSDPITAGIHKLQLAAHQIYLQAGIEYEWSVSLIHDPQQPSRNRVASATLTYVKASPELAMQVTNKSPLKAASLWAEHGYWYDTLESLSEPLEQNPNNQLLKRYRSTLLDQVGLSGADTHQ